MKTIEQLLVDDATRVVDDDGFTRRVMAALPPPSPVRVGWKPALILGSTALGCVLAAFFAPAGASAMQGVLDLAASRFLTPGALAVAGTAMTLAIAGAVLAADA